jgi:hypothetical protein
MRNFVLRSALGLSIIAGSLAASPAANATTWRNLKDINKCLGVYAASGNLGTQLIIWDCLAGHPDQSWTEQFFPLALGYNYYITGQVRNGTNPPVADMVAAVSGGIMNSNTNIIDYTKFNPPHGDQGWKKVFAVNDPDGFPCYYFANYASPSTGSWVFGTQNAGTGNNTPVVLQWLVKTANGNPDYGAHPEQYWCAH